MEVGKIENDADSCKAVIFGKEIVREVVGKIENDADSCKAVIFVKEIVREVVREIQNDVRETVYLILQHSLEKRPQTYCYYIVLESYHLSIYQFPLEVGSDFLCQE